MMSRFLMKLIVVAVSIVQLTSAATWEPLLGTAKSISAKGDQVMMVNPVQQFFIWKDNQWENVESSAGLVRMASPTADGSFGWTIAEDGIQDAYNVYRWRPRMTLRMEPITAGKMCYLNGVGTTTAIGVDCAGFLHQFSWNGREWRLTKVNGVRNAVAASIGVDNEIWVLQANGTIIRKNDKDGWDQLPWLFASTIDVQEKNRAIVSTNKGTVHQWNGSKWTQLTGIPNLVKATINRDYAFAIDNLGAIYRMAV